ncbi:hypothetical protein ACJJI4_01675 [Microbulbifer sp. TRSA002]|uniref:hypothetical protein n=1 Tax=Microbulbifer sp. TRSA002 TaxID=3243382 RepID=UPI00403A3770
MTCWDIIGISATVDKRAIKRAYASKLKKHRPDEDPEGFKQLRLAYEEALEETKSYHPTQEQSAPQSSPVPAAENTAAQAATHAQREIIDSDRDSCEQAVTKLQQAVVELYEDFNARIQLGNWQAIFDQAETWDIEVLQRIALGLLQFIGRNPFIPSEVISYLESQFAWQENHSWLQQYFEEDFLRYVLNHAIVCRWGPSYRDIRFPENSDLETVETYLRQRKLLTYLLDDPEDDERDALLSALQGHNVQDPELYRLLSSLYLNEGDLARALQYSEQLNNTFSGNIDGHLRSANLYYRQGYFSAAFSAYESALAIDEEHPLALKGLAACYLQRCDLFASKHLFEQALAQVPFDMEARIQLVQINQKIIQQGLEHLEKHPKDTREQRYVAEGYLEIGAYHEAIQFLLPLTKSGFFSKADRDGEFHYLLGLAYEAIDQLEAAENAFNRSLNLAVMSGGNGYEALVKLGETAYVNNKFKWAEKMLLQARHFNPESSKVLRLLAGCQLGQEEPEKLDEALENINHAIRINSEEHHSYTLRALIFRATENYSAEAADLNQVLEYCPTCDRHWHKLGLCLLKLQQLDEAMTAFENATLYNTARQDSALQWIQLALGTGNRDSAQLALEALERAEADPVQITLFKETIERMSSEVANEPNA